MTAVKTCIGSTPELVEGSLQACEGCAAMRKEYGRDPDLLGFYATKLLIRGWAKGTSAAEKLYLSNHSEWYQSAQEKGRALASRYPIESIRDRAYPQNIKGAPPQPVTQEPPGVLTGLEASP